MGLLAQSAFLKALGWALLHSLWQMGILWFLYSLVTANGKRFLARQRYNIALIFLFIGSVAFLSTLALEFYQFKEPSVVYVNDEIVGTNTFGTIASYLEPGLPLISVAYLLAIGLLFIRFFRQYYYSQRLMKDGLHKADPELRIFLEQMAQRFHINKKIRIGLSEIINTPLTIGFWKPMILLPVAAINHLSIKQTESIILHELNHIKQNDYLVNLLVAALDIILFFNPFTRVLSSTLVKERENSCDDMVLQFRYPACDYARALLILEQHRTEAIPLLAVAATGNNNKLLLRRVERILYGKNNSASINHKMFAFLLSALLIAFTGWYNPAKVIQQQFPSLAAKALPEVSQGSAELATVFAALSETTSQPELEKNEAVKTFSPTDTKYINEEMAVVSEETDEDEIPLPESISVASDQSRTGQTIIGFATNLQSREFAMQDNNLATTVPEAYNEFLVPQPYVPSSSFSYQYVEDTSYPKKYIPTASDLKAKEDLEKALKALEAIDWQKLEKEVGAAAQKLNITKLQAELKRALRELDWKQLDEEVRAELKLAEQELLEKQAFLQQLEKFQRNRILKQQAEQKKQQLIIMDRLLQNDELKKCEEEKQKAQSKKVKKIVVI